MDNFEIFKEAQRRIEAGKHPGPIEAAVIAVRDDFQTAQQALSPAPEPGTIIGRRKVVFPDGREIEEEIKA